VPLPPFTEQWRLECGRFCFNKLKCEFYSHAG
jgi:hypothetical protein